MEDLLSDCFQNVRLTNEEEDNIIVTSVNRAALLEECEYSLLGRFLAKKPPNLRAAKTTLRSAWRMGDDLRIVEVGNGLLQFKFANEFQMKWVQDHGPWNFDNYLLLLRKWSSGMTSINTKFTHAPFWIQVWGVPFDLMAEEVGKAIGKKVGHFLQINKRTWTGDNANFLRIRVEVPLDKPLRRGGYVLSPEGHRVWVHYKYERLPAFCNRCGVMGHTILHCPLQGPPDEPLLYGDWLNAQWRKGTKPQWASPESHTTPEPRTTPPRTQPSDPQDTGTPVHNPPPVPVHPAPIDNTATPAVHLHQSAAISRSPPLPAHRGTMTSISVTEKENIPLQIPIPTYPTGLISNSLNIERDTEVNQNQQTSTGIMRDPLQDVSNTPGSHYSINLLRSGQKLWK